MIAVSHRPEMGVEIIAGAGTCPPATTTLVLVLMAFSSASISAM